MKFAQRSCALHALCVHRQDTGMQQYKKILTGPGAVEFHEPSKMSQRYRFGVFSADEESKRMFAGVSPVKHELLHLALLYGSERAVDDG